MLKYLLGKSVSFTILMDTTMLKDEKGNHLALLSNFLNSKQSSGLNESNYLYLLLSDLLLFRRNQGKRLFYFIVCHQMVIYHFDLIALILQKTASQDFFFFLKAIFFVSQWESQKKIYQASDACIFNFPGFYHGILFLIIRILHFQISSAFTPH